MKTTLSFMNDVPSRVNLGGKRPTIPKGFGRGGDLPARWEVRQRRNASYSSCKHFLSRRNLLSPFTPSPLINTTPTAPLLNPFRPRGADGMAGYPVRGI